jgi:Putative quorum-sensing-regulated virulence factor
MNLPAMQLASWNARRRRMSKRQSSNQERFMLRLIVPTLSLLLALPLAAQAASKQEFELNKLLQKVATESSVGTPRAINEDILDQGYTVEGKALINHLSVRAEHAARMQQNPEQVRSQLGDSVCRNSGFRNLMSKGAVMVYRFSVYKTNQPVMDQAFDAASCTAGNKKK